MKKELNLSEVQKNEIDCITNLQNVITSGNMDADAVQDLKNMISKKKEKLVRDIYFADKKRKTFYQCADGRIKSRNPDCIAPTEEELIEKLYQKYFEKNTLENVYEAWIKHRAKTGIVTPKTIEEDISMWKRFLANSTLAKMKIVDIRKKHILTLFDEWIGNMKITKKDFFNRKSLLNGIWGYAIREEILDTNPVISISLEEYKFKPPRCVRKNYTNEERKILLDYLDTLEPDAYVLAIQLAFRTVLRVGEIKGLKWNTYDGNLIHIAQQIVEERHLNEDFTLTSPIPKTKYPKGNPNYSIRDQRLGDKSVEILKKMKELNPDGEFIFMHKGHPLTTDSFNRRLKKYCQEAGIEYLSSHKIRFTGATMLYESGQTLTMLQYILGHSNLQMTLNYIRQNVTPDGLEQIAKTLD